MLYGCPPGLTKAAGGEGEKWGEMAGTLGEDSYVLPPLQTGGGEWTVKEDDAVLLEEVGGPLGLAGIGKGEIWLDGFLEMPSDETAYFGFGSASAPGSRMGSPKAQACDLCWPGMGGMP